MEWKSAHIIPIFKKGQKDLVKNYRPISLKSLIAKTLERLIYNRIFGFIESSNLLSSHQYGFCPGYSCTSQLIHLFHEWAKALDKRLSTDVIFLDFEKAFDSVPHDRLLLKLERFGISGSLSPHQAYLIEKLECVQRNVTRWIIDKDTLYEDRLKSLQLATLVQRREFLSLIQLFKFI